MRKVRRPVDNGERSFSFSFFFCCFGAPEAPASQRVPGVPLSEVPQTRPETGFRPPRESGKTKGNQEELVRAAGEEAMGASVLSTSSDRRCGGGGGGPVREGTRGRPPISRARRPQQPERRFVRLQ